MSDIKKRCQEVFSAALEVDPEVINDETNPDNLPEWDSLAHIQLILELEKAFSISIPPDEGIELESFKKVCEWLEKKVAS